MKRITILDIEKKLNLTPADIAERSDIHLATVYRMRKGQDVLNSTVEKVVRGLGLKPSQLVIEAPEEAA